MSDNRRDRDSYGPPAQAQASGTATAGARLYDRRFSVQVYSGDGKGLDLSGLRCTFAVRQWEMATPNYVDLHITNLSATTAARMQKEFTRLQISAGYEGQYGIIFDGTIIQSRRGRDSPTDTFCHIVASDGDKAHNEATVSTTLAAGSKPEDVHKTVLSAFQQQGVEQGYTDKALTGPGLPRGRTLFGMARDIMRDVGKTTDTVWSIQNGRMQVTSREGYLPGEAVVITRETGMIGLPIIAPDGIHVRCLLNPLLRIGTLVKLDNNSIQTARLSPDPGGTTAQALLPELEGNGTYKVLAVDHFGDTRGNPWYSQVEAIAVHQSGTAASSHRGRGSYVDPTSQPVQAAPLVAPTPAPVSAPAPAAPPAPLPATAPPTPGSAHTPVIVGRTGY